MNRRGVVIAPEELDEQWIRQILDGGINVVGLHPDPREGSAEVAIERFLSGHGAAFIKELEARGVAVEWHVHALSCLMPRELFATHPQWFRMNSNGQRTADYNLCSSSEAALQVVRDGAARVAKLFRPISHRYYFWLDDVAEGACHCDACRGYSQADQALRIYNAILQGIRQVDPEAMHCYLAYHDTNACPQRVEPEPGIFLQYAPFEREHDKPLADPLSQRNRKEISQLRQLLEYFGPEDAQVLDYWLDNSLFSDWKKPPKPFRLHRAVLRQDLALYRELGFDHVMTFACYLGEEYRSLHGNSPDIAVYARDLKEM